MFKLSITKPTGSAGVIAKGTSRLRTLNIPKGTSSMNLAPVTGARDVGTVTPPAPVLGGRGTINRGVVQQIPTFTGKTSWVQQLQDPMTNAFTASAQRVADVLRSGVVSGIGTFKSGFAGTAKMIGESEPSIKGSTIPKELTKGFAKYADTVIANTDQWIAANEPQFQVTWLESKLRELTSAGVSIGLSMGLGLLTKAGGLSAAVFGATQTGNKYTEQVKAGVPEKRAAGISSVQGLAEAAVEFLGVDTYLKLRNGTFVNILLRSLNEGAQEGLQTFNENLFDKLWDKNQTLKEGVAESIIIGCLAGFPGSAVTSVAEQSSPRGQTIKQAMRLGLSEKEAVAIVDGYIESAINHAKPLVDETLAEAAKKVTIPLNIGTTQKIGQKTNPLPVTSGMGTLVGRPQTVSGGVKPAPRFHLAIPARATQEVAQPQISPTVAISTQETSIPTSTPAQWTQLAKEAADIVGTTKPSGRSRVLGQLSNGSTIVYAGTSDRLLAELDETKSPVQIKIYDRFYDKLPSTQIHTLMHEMAHEAVTRWARTHQRDYQDFWNTLEPTRGMPGNFSFRLANGREVMGGNPDEILVNLVVAYRGGDPEIASDQNVIKIEPLLRQISEGEASVPTPSPAIAPQIAEKPPMGERIKMVLYHGGKPFSQSRGVVWLSTSRDVAGVNAGNPARWHRIKALGGDPEQSIPIETVPVELTHPYVVDAKEASYSEIKTPKELLASGYTKLTTVDTDIIAEWAQKNGYDGVIIKNVFEGKGASVVADTVAVFKNETPIPAEKPTAPTFNKAVSEMSEDEFVNKVWEGYPVAPEGYTLLYHATPEWNVDSIIKDGLKTGTKDTDGRKNVVWATTEPTAYTKDSALIVFKVPSGDSAVDYANQKERMVRRPIPAEDIVQVYHAIYGEKGGMMVNTREDVFWSETEPGSAGRIWNYRIASPSYKIAESPAEKPEAVPLSHSEYDDRNERAALDYIKSPTNLRKELSEARSSLKKEYADKFKDAILDAAGKRLVTTDGEYELRWQTRLYPDKPASYDNPQTNRGSVSLYRSPPLSKMEPTPAPQGVRVRSSPAQSSAVAPTKPTVGKKVTFQSVTFKEPIDGKEISIPGITNMRFALVTSRATNTALRGSMYQVYALETGQKAGQARMTKEEAIQSVLDTLEDNRNAGETANDVITRMTANIEIRNPQYVITNTAPAPASPTPAQSSVVPSKRLDYNRQHPLADIVHKISSDLQAWEVLDSGMGFSPAWDEADLLEHISHINESASRKAEAISDVTKEILHQRYRYQNDWEVRGTRKETRQYLGAEKEAGKIVNAVLGYISPSTNPVITNTAPLPPGFTSSGEAVTPSYTSNEPDLATSGTGQTIPASKDDIARITVAFDDVVKARREGRLTKATEGTYQKMFLDALKAAGVPKGALGWKDAIQYYKQSKGEPSLESRLAKVAEAVEKYNAKVLGEKIVSIAHKREAKAAVKEAVALAKEQSEEQIAENGRILLEKAKKAVEGQKFGDQIMLAKQKAHSDAILAAMKQRAANQAKTMEWLKAEADRKARQKAETATLKRGINAVSMKATPAEEARGIQVATAGVKGAEKIFEKPSSTQFAFLAEEKGLHVEQRPERPEQREVDLPELRKIAARVKALRDSGLEKKDAITQARRESIEQRADAVTAQLLTSIRPTVIPDIGKESHAQVRPDKVKEVIQWIADAKGRKVWQFQELDGFKRGVITQTLYDDAIAMENTVRSSDRLLSERIRERLSKNGITGKSYNAKRTLPNGQVLTQAQVLLVAVNSLNEDNLYHLMAGNGYSEETIAQAIRSMTKEEVDTANMILDEERGAWPAVNAAYEYTHNGESLPQLENFVHIELQHGDEIGQPEGTTAEELIHQDVIAQGWVQNATSKGWEKQRVPKSSIPLREDPIATFISYIKQTTDFIGRERTAQDILQIVKDVHVKDAYQLRSGHEGYSSLLDYAKDLANPAGALGLQAVAPKGRKFERILRNSRLASSCSILALRLSKMATAGASYVTSAGQVGLETMLYGTAKLVSNPRMGMRTIKELMPILYDRIIDPVRIEAEVSMLEKSWERGRSQLRDWENVTFRIADTADIASEALGELSRVQREHPEWSIEKSAYEVQRMVLSTHSSDIVEDKPDIYKLGEVARVITAFTGEATAAADYLNYLGRGAAKGKIPKHRFFRQLLFTIVGVALVMRLADKISQGRKKDPKADKWYKTWWGYSLLSLIENTIPILGRYITQGLQGITWASAPVALKPLEIVKNIFAAIAQGDMKDIAQNVAELAGYLTAAPVEGVNEAIRWLTPPKTTTQVGPTQLPSLPKRPSPSRPPRP